MPRKKKEAYSPLLDNLFGRKQKEGRTVDWTEVDRTLMGDLVAACSTIGCGVLFGTTRDRGAWAITFFWDGFKEAGHQKNSQTVYCNAEEMLESWLSEWVQNWTEIAQEASQD